MQVVIDIDGTLCFNNRAFFFQLCNTTFELGIASDRFAGMTHADFLAQPEVIALRSQLGADLFAHRLGWLNFHPQAILAALPIPGAVEGVATLADLGPVSYYTARFSSNKQRHAAIVSSTQQWLVDHQFIHPHRVTFCDGIQDKLLLLMQLARDTGEYVVLVDDSYERLLAILASIADEQARSAFLSKFMLIAVRARELPAQTHNVRLLALPHWRDIKTLIQHIQYEEIVCS
jgi:uncharacterized HAD superfamily protein